MDKLQTAVSECLWGVQVTQALTGLLLHPAVYFKVLQLSQDKINAPQEEVSKPGFLISCHLYAECNGDVQSYALSKVCKYFIVS